MENKRDSIYFQTCSFPDSDDMLVEFINEETEQNLLEIKISKNKNDFKLKFYNHSSDVEIPFDIFNKGIEVAKSKII